MRCQHSPEGGVVNAPGSNPQPRGKSHLNNDASLLKYSAISIPPADSTHAAFLIRTSLRPFFFSFPKLHNEIKGVQIIVLPPAFPLPFLAHVDHTEHVWADKLTLYNTLRKKIKADTMPSIFINPRLTSSTTVWSIVMKMYLPARPTQIHYKEEGQTHKAHLIQNPYRQLGS